MKRHILTAVIIFIILNFLTIIGKLINDKYFNSMGGDFFTTIPYKLIFAGLFLLTAFINIKVDISLRLPIIRTILWSAFVIPEFFWKPPIDGEPSSVLYLNNGGICSLYNSYWNLYSFNCVGCKLWEDTILPGIILFGIFEYIIIKTSDKISVKIIGLKKVNSEITKATSELEN